MGEVGIGLAVLGILLFGLWGLVLLLFFKGRRKKGGLIFGAAFVALIVVGSLLGSQNDEIAREAGFEDYQSYSEALKAGITDPAEWALEVDRRAKVEAEEQRIKDQEEARLEAERQAREEESRRVAAEEEVRAEAERLAEQQQAEAEKEEERRKGFHCLSLWDGSHREFTRDVKQRMREPDSFEHIETRVTPVDDRGSHRIRMEYRARNGFGGMNVGVATGTYLNSDCAHTLISVE